MKLYYIANVRIPTEKAHGIQIAKMCEAFSKHYEVELIVPRRLNSIKQGLFSFYSIEPCFKIVRIPCIDFISFGFGKIGFWLESLTFFSAAKIYLFFQKNGIIYTRDFIAGFFFSDLIVEAHYFPEHIGYFLKMFLKKIKIWIVLTSFIKQKLEKEGVPKKNILIAPDAVDIQKFDIVLSKQDAREYLGGIPKNKKIIVYTGNLYEWKGIKTLVQSGNYLNNNYAIYVIGGTEKEFSDFKRDDKFHRAHFEGYWPHKDIPRWLKAADVLVLPNTDQEAISCLYTSPMKMFEYMASQRPIVASDLPSLREVLNENNAFLAQPGNAEELARTVEKAVNDPSAQAKAQRAYQDVQNYTWEKRAEIIAGRISSAQGL